MPRQKDYTGMRFGATVALYPTAKRKKNNVVWMMRCDCGKEFERSTGDMRRCDTCGCIRGGGLRKDLTGIRTANAVAIRDTGKSAYKSAIWVMRCDFCGEEFEASASAIRSGHAAHKCAGWRTWMNKRLQKKKMRKPGPRLVNSQAHVNVVFANYVAGAKRRGIAMDLTMEQFRSLIEQPCFYCGADPFTRRTNIGLAGSFAWNGIDRFDNTVGYVPDNCVPCCPRCNRAKGTMNGDDFISWVRTICHHLESSPVRPLSGK